MAYKAVTTASSEWTEDEIQEAICEYYYRQFMTGKKPKHPEGQPLTPAMTGLPSYPMLNQDGFVEKKVHWRDAVYSPQSRLSA